MTKPQITAIIPARNEEKSITKTLDALLRIPMALSVIVVSDRRDAGDRTEDVVIHYIKHHKRVRLVRKSISDKNGFAATLARGIKAVKTPYTVFVMADLCDDPKTIPVMYKTIQKGYDVVCGSRYMRGGKRTGGPVIQGICSRIINAFLPVFSGVPAHDMSNAFKLYRTVLLKTLSVDISSGSEVSIELISEAYKKGARITEVPTVWRGRTEGQSKFKLLSQMKRYGKVIVDEISAYYRRGRVYR